MEKDLVIIYSSGQEYQVKIAQELLDEHGIESFTLNQHDSVIPSIGLVELYVNQKDQENAEKILKKLKR
ncbi:DUF2007 domain-containing protein [uncultured Sunxiuqinia sp.]|uniref:putative signal transducing protein n=1 Tax=uncultured Sunxiuqinia sp. TaxID=1573825 RepID=UPI002AA7A0F1|nr:DUF2007 domain-containing protein [uncultured Sunxiuqinia sp.]